jgi:hypothetical protein
VVARSCCRQGDSCSQPEANQLYKQPLCLLFAFVNIIQRCATCAVCSTSAETSCVRTQLVHTGQTD